MYHGLKSGEVGRACMFRVGGRASLHRNSTRLLSDSSGPL